MPQKGKKRKTTEKRNVSCETFTQYVLCKQRALLVMKRALKAGEPVRQGNRGLAH